MASPEAMTIDDPSPESTSDSEASSSDHSNISGGLDKITASPFVRVAKHDLPIETVLQDLRDAYRQLPEEYKTAPDPSACLRAGSSLSAWEFVWEWKDDGKLKQRFLDRLKHLNVSSYKHSDFRPVVKSVDKCTARL